jgi:hypothetical protein
MQQLPMERGNVVILATNHASAPFSLRSLTVSVDGEQEETTQGKALQHPDSEPVHVGSMRVTRGQHTLSVRTSAEDSSSDHVVSLATIQSFRIDSLPASITVHVFTPRSGIGHDRRLDLSFDIQGGRMRAPLGAIASAPAGSARCAELSPVHAAICRTELVVEQASSARDPLLIMCTRDRLAQMRTFAIAAEPDPSNNPPVPATRYDSDVTRMACERVLKLEQELSGCATTEMRAGVLAGSW